MRTELAGRLIHDAVIARRRHRGEPEVEGPQSPPLGLRWTVERTNSWLSNHGQLRRNTDRRTVHRLAQLALAIVLIITAKLIDCHERWNRSFRHTPPAQGGGPTTREPALCDGFLSLPCTPGQQDQPRS